MAKLGSRDLLISGAGLVGAFLFYSAVQTKKKALKSGVPGGYGWEDGLDPNFQGGKKFTDPRNVDSHDGFRPSCQQWDSDIQLFDNAGHPDWDKDQQTCFTNVPSSAHARYIDKDGKVTFKEDDKTLLTDDPSEHGICYFYDANHNSYSFPNIGGMNPVNRSRRLCFNSGTSVADTGVQFKQIGADPANPINKWWWNPNVPIELSDPHVSWQTVDPTNAIIPEKDLTVDRCELPTQLTQSGLSVPVTWYAWVHTKLSQLFDKDMDGCVKQSGRYWQPEYQRIVYLDKASNKKVTTPILSGIIQPPDGQPPVSAPSN